MLIPAHCWLAEHCPRSLADFFLDKQDPFLSFLKLLIQLDLVLLDDKQSTAVEQLYKYLDCYEEMFTSDSIPQSSDMEGFG